MARFSLAIIGKTGSGKSFCIAPLVGDKNIQKSMIGENILGKTKTNIRYLLYKEDISTEIEVDINRETIQELIVVEDGEKYNYDKLINEIKRIFVGIELDIENNKKVIKNVEEKLKIYIESRVTKENYVDIFNNNIEYVNFVKNLVIKSKMSNLGKKLIKVDELEIVDTRGVFDNDGTIKRSTPNATANIILMDKNGSSEELIDIMCERTKHIFIKPVSIWIHDNSYDLDKDYSVEVEVDRYEKKRDEFEEYSRSIKNIMEKKGYIIPRSLDDEEDIRYNLITNSKVNIIPHVGKDRTGKFKNFDLNVFTQIICRGINEIIDIYLKIQNYGKNISKRWSSKKDIIYELIEKIAEEKSIDVCEGRISGIHRHQQPKKNKMSINAEAKYNYENAKMKYYKLASQKWINEYIKHYSTVVAAEVLAGLNREVTNKLEALSLEYEEKVEIILIARAVYQYVVNLSPTNGYRWENGSLDEVRISKKSYMKAVEELEKINKKFKGKPFHYENIGKNLVNRFPIAIMYCLILNSAYSEVNNFARDGLEKTINNQIKLK